MTVGEFFDPLIRGYRKIMRNLDPDLIHDAATDTGHNGVSQEIHEHRVMTGDIVRTDHGPMTVTMTNTREAGK